MVYWMKFTHHISWRKNFGKMNFFLAREILGWYVGLGCRPAGEGAVTDRGRPRAAQQLQQRAGRNHQAKD